MAYKIPKHHFSLISKERQKKSLSVFIQKVDRETKEDYLMKVGLFHKEAIKEMSDTQLNELIEQAVKVKGFELQ